MTKTVFQKVDKSVNRLLDSGWKLDRDARCDQEDIQAFCGGVLKRFDDFCYFLMNYGKIHRYEDTSSHTLALRTGTVFGELATIQENISLCQSISDWPEQLIPFYADAAGDYFCFELGRSGDRLRQITCYLHDTRRYHPSGVGTSFLEFLEYCQKSIPDCWDLVRSFED